MKAVQFESTVGQGGQISLPPEVAAEVPVGEQLKVVVMWEPSATDSEWRAMGRRQFEAAYADEDAVYEQLMDDASGR